MPSQGKHIETNIPLGFTPDELQSFHKFMERQFRFRLRWYNSQSAERRLKKVIKAFGLRSLTDLEQRLISCDYSFQDFVSESNVMPFFKRSQKIKVLIVGCSTGEELASICILLKENMMLERSEILATDIDEAALQKAKNPSIKRYDKSSNNKRYKIACGQADLDNYFSGVGSFSFLNESLLKTVSYKKFDLCSDNLQDQFDIIFCRNVLIYFQYQEQHQLIDNLSRHLKPQGFLALGEKETIIHMKNLKDAFAIVSGEQNIYRKLNK
jgi:chemotaxis protein methyltransferase CheR